MDYSFYGASQQPYQYMGMPPNAFANPGIDPEAMRSTVSALQCCVVWAAPQAVNDRP